MTRATSKTFRNATPARPVIRLAWLEGSIGFHLRAAQEAAFQAFARRVGGFAAQPWHFAVLSLIDSNPGLSQAALAKVTRRDTSSLTAALNDLSRRGFVVRERVETNRRTYALTLTPAGRKALRELMAMAREHERDFERLVGASGKAGFIRTLQRIAEGFAEGGVPR